MEIISKVILAIMRTPLFVHILDKIGISDKIVSWLKGDPQDKAFQKALDNAIAEFERAHPIWTHQFFDEHFFKNRAAPLLKRRNPPDPAELVKAWADQFYGSACERVVTEVTSVAADFLRLFEGKLRACDEFRPLFDSRAADGTEQKVTKVVEVVEKLREELAQPRGVIAVQFDSITPIEERSHNRQQLPITSPALPPAVPSRGSSADSRKQEASDVPRTPAARELNARKLTTEPPTIRQQPKERGLVSNFLDKVREIPTHLPFLRGTEPQNQGDFDRLNQLKPPVGAVHGQFYVKRDADAEFKRLIPQEGTTIIIRGPRQTGKSSLLVQGVDHAREHGIRVVRFDLESVEKADIKSYERFLRILADSIVLELELDLNEVELEWGRPLTTQHKLSRVLVNYVLPKSDQPIMLALDSVDRLLHFDFRTDFFSLLRSWHNSRAADPQWRKLNIVLAISTEPHLLIADKNRSPFGVGQSIYLEDFRQEQVAVLNQWHGSPLKESQIPELMALLNGHPYLTRQALYTLVTKSWSWSKLMDVAISDDGPFGQHLRHCYGLLRDQNTLKKGLKQVIDRQSCPEETFYRLKRAGLVAGSDKQATFRCDLYRRYFEKKVS